MLNVKMKEVIIVDDGARDLEVACGLAEKVGLKPIAFEKPSEALAHLRTRENAPVGYIVNMKPRGFIPKDVSLKKDPELPIPEQIFDYVSERGWAQNFYFTASGLSYEDHRVIMRTGAAYFLKGNELSSRLQQMLE